MFYSVFVLGKKGPLARVWLAAHWDKKITKAQILETNIVESVDSILQPRVKLSLRTSSHLLLGIVRIYSRKTLYLLQDCQDAAFKIKSAFRPGAVDLPDSKSEAAISAITLPEMLDFVEDFDLIAEPPIQVEPLQTNANIRNITLVEDMSSIHVDDPILSEVRDWSGLQSFQPDAGEGDGPGEGRSSTAKEGANPLDIFDRPPADDGFGGPIVGDVDDMFAIPIPPEAQEAEKSAGTAEKPHEERPSSRLSDASSMSYGAPLSAAPSGPPSTPGSVPIPDEDMGEVPGEPIPDAGAGEAGDHAGPSDGAPFRRPADLDTTMVLEPLEGGGIERRRKRRKKLGIILDDVKTLSGEEMKGQLSDTSDIVATLDLAPPSKKMMQWKKTGGSEKLFSIPERTLPSKTLMNHYILHLITRRQEVEEMVMVNGEVHPLPQLEELEQPPPPSPLKEIQPPRTPRTPRRDWGELRGSPAKKRRKMTQEEKDRRAEKARTPRVDIEERLENHISDQNFYDSRTSNLPEGRRDASHMMSSIRDQSSVQFHPDEEEEDYNDFQYDQPQSVGPVDDMMPDETVEQYEERIRNKMTKILLQFMSKQLDDEGSLVFSRLVRNNRRKQVAQKFFSLLVLKKQQAIELIQDTTVPYGEITISRGHRYEEALGTSL